MALVGFKGLNKFTESTNMIFVFQTHKSTCSFVGVKCTYKDCDATPLKKDLQNHVTNECPKRKVECLYCKKASFIWCTRQVNDLL